MSESMNAAIAALIKEMRLTDASVEHRLRALGFGSDDVRRVKALREPIEKHVEQLAADFFERLAALDETTVPLRTRALHAQALELKREHIRAMFGGEYSLAYVSERLKLVRLYAQAGVSASAFIGAFGYLTRALAKVIAGHDEAHPDAVLPDIAAVDKIASFDLSISVDALINERERIIRQQAEALREMSTPVLQLRDRLLILPIIGLIDTQRARQITESLLRSIREKRAKVVVLDITGVPMVDSKVANHLMQTVAAARLMGTTAIVTGLSAEVAQALVTLGVDLGNVRTAADLQSGLEEGEALLGGTLAAKSSGAA